MTDGVSAVLDPVIVVGAEKLNGTDMVDEVVLEDVVSCVG